MADKAKLVSDTQAVWDDKDETKGATDGYLNDLKANCDWIEDQFENRKTQRKSEINGDLAVAVLGLQSHPSEHTRSGCGIRSSAVLDSRIGVSSRADRGCLCSRP